MTQHEQDLLLKDLCARLPYGVWIERKLKSCKFGAKCMLHAHDIDAIERGQYVFYKPYLFPLSNMTEEQKKEYDSIIYHNVELHWERYYDVIDGDSFEELQDFYHKNHLDYRGLIPMGLAIDATGLNVY